ncbi:hypothetical protein JOD24_001201 [Kroppenstedtia sanguinis]
MIQSGPEVPNRFVDRNSFVVRQWAGLFCVPHLQISKLYKLHLVPLQAILILFFSKAEAGGWGGSDLLQRAHSETGNGVTLARLVPYGYKGESNPHPPYLSVISHTIFSEGALETLPFFIWELFSC